LLENCCKEARGEKVDRKLHGRSPNEPRFEFSGREIVEKTQLERGGLQKNLKIEYTVGGKKVRSALLTI